ncbi:hypothetical protein [Absidia glauca]|uniref:Transcription activator GCR1-like domain-containing protein n=1 Tax=Absidia glauca TaxID=4829 RepID=A0A168PZ41_ABSGL|nr:hypothetical protein [Absidia glauca]
MEDKSGAALRSLQHPRRNHQPVNINNHHQASLPLPQQQAPPSLPPPPLYRMSRGIKTITYRFREWCDGLAGGYPVKTLERQWGVKWRKD